jgi:hypothetical protein
MQRGARRNVRVARTPGARDGARDRARDDAHDGARDAAGGRRSAEGSAEGSAVGSAEERGDGAPHHTASLRYAASTVRKLLGTALTFLAFGCAAFFVAAVGDLITGGSPETSAGVLAGLAVFFGGLAATTGFGAWRLFTTKGTSARAASLSANAASASTASPGKGIDIDLEARVLALAAQHDGRVTVAEVAVACGVSLDRAEAALDLLTQRGHADLHITSDADRVYVLRGFLSDEEKQQAEDVVEATRSR